MTKPKKGKPGPNGDRLKLDGDWRAAIGGALSKKRPADGWLERQVTKRKKRKKR